MTRCAARVHEISGCPLGRCIVEPRLAAILGVSPGHQIRLRMPGRGSALLTVDIDSSVDGVAVRTGSVAAIGGVSRGMSDVDFVLDSVCADPSLTDDEACARQDFVERLVDNGVQRDLLAIAPHGGGIERGTDDQVDLIAGYLGASRASAWSCRGWSTGVKASNGSAFARWHVASTLLCTDSFPALASISDRGFRRCVAFHGYSGDGVLVGGAAPNGVKEAVADEVSRALHGTSITVALAPPTGRYSGSDPANIVNRLTEDGGGVQLEQSLLVRRRHSLVVAHAVGRALSRR